ncbi:unnamed protein product [Allacma fusca]|uniref:Uncharacterized protein n=1 Tax=Allacma fusca TaxID=39272 RepID=A0A8J2K1T3_9HEXA|nr:unnamed protein product [Allacma fusca]
MATKFFVTEFILLIATVELICISVCQEPADTVEVVIPVTTSVMPLVTDCQALKEQLDGKALELDGLLKRLEGLEGVSSLLQSNQLDIIKNVTSLSDMLDAAVFSVSGLNVSEAALTQELTSATSMLMRMNSSMTSMESKHAKLDSHVGSMSGTFGKMNASMRRLANTNQIWRSNFRIVNTTFRNIRKKVNFPVPAFNLGNARDDEIMF